VDQANGINYALNAAYAPHGAPASVQNGASLVSTLFYNNRLQRSADPRPPRRTRADRFLSFSAFC
jgi:hypothetical protein